MVPLALLLLLGVGISIRSGRGSVLCALMALALGALTASSPITQTLVSSLETGAQTVSSMWSGVT